MRLMMLGALLLALGLATPLAHALDPASATYRVTYNRMSASGSMRVQPMSDGRWTMSMRISNMIAGIDQVTVFDLVDGRMRPLGSSRHVNYPLGRKAVTAKFDWPGKQVTWRGDVKATRTGPIRLATGDLDPLLLNLALARDGAHRRSSAYRMAENGRVRTVRYTNLGRTTIEVAGKAREATRLFNQNGNKRTVVWIIPGMDLPARILQTETGGETIDLRMQ